MRRYLLDRRLIIFTVIILTMFSSNIVAIGAHAELENEPKWSYLGKTGPQYWGSLDPSSLKCSKGLRQSPINFSTTNIKKSIKLSQMKFLYTTTSFKILNTGHTIQLVPQNQKNILWIDNEAYFLKQFHFHHLSEHEINNKRFPMEIHFVHQNSNGKMAVIGVLVKEGLQNNELKSIFKNIHKTVGLEGIVKKQMNLLTLLPKEKSYLTYEGSLTTPPCTEGVTWYIFKEPIEMAKQQIRSFAELYPSNYRPLQPTNNREVYESLK